MITEKIIFKQAETCGSFYLYDEDTILEYTRRLKRDFDDVEFLYSVKSNPNPLVVECVLKQGFGVDAASLAEVMIGRKNGITPDRILYSAPGKTAHDIGHALDHCVIIADSLNEIRQIQETAAARGVTANIGVRINPDFTFYGETGIPSKFGIDEDQAFEQIPSWKKLPNIRIIGIHVHSRSQELSAAVLEHYYENMFHLAMRFQEKLGSPLQFINMGSGIGVPYSPDDKALDTVSLGDSLKTMIRRFRPVFPDARIYVETGRYAVGKCGIYVTKVIDKKVSHGRTFVILDKTLNGFIRPSLTQLVLNYTKEDDPAGCEPLFTGKDAFEFLCLPAIPAYSDPTTTQCRQSHKPQRGPLHKKETETVTLVGSLCTAADIIANDIALPRLSPGDLIIMTNAGSYAAAITPMQFASQVPPEEFFVTHEGKVLTAGKGTLPEKP